MAPDPQHIMMSIDEYLAFVRDSPDVRYEFIDGQIYMLAGGTTNHSLISANLIRELGFLLRGSPCRVYTSDMLVSDSAPAMRLEHVLLKSPGEACLVATGAFEWMRNTMYYPPQEQERA